MRVHLLLKTAPMLFFLIVFILAHFYTNSLILFLEQYAPDGKIENPQDILQKLKLGLFSLCLIATIMIFNFSLIYKEFVKCSCFPEKFEIMIVLSLLAIHFVSIFYNDIGKIYAEDALLENLTAVFALVSGIILLYSINFSRDKNVRFYVLVFAVACLFFGFEEISWGQRIFAFESPDFFVEHNFQKETTLHNFVNPILTYLMTLFNLILSAYFRFNGVIVRAFPAELSALLQHPAPTALSFVFLVLTIQSYLFKGELSEEIVSVIMLFSSLRFFLSVKSN